MPSFETKQQNFFADMKSTFLGLFFEKTVRKMKKSSKNSFVLEPCLKLTKQQKFFAFCLFFFSFWKILLEKEMRELKKCFLLFGANDLSCTHEISSGWKSVVIKLVRQN